MEALFDFKDKNADDLIVDAIFLEKKVKVFKNNLFIEIDKKDFLNLFLDRNINFEHFFRHEDRIFIHPYRWIHHFGTDDPGVFVRILKHIEKRFNKVEDMDLDVKDSTKTWIQKQIIDRFGNIFSTRLY